MSLNPMPRGRILAIDDEAEILENFELCLLADGHRYAGFTSVEEGLLEASSERYDLCLLDRHIGRDCGVETLPKLKQLAPWMRVIMITAHADVDAALEALRAGADDYLVKPCSPEQLSVAVARQLEAGRLSQRIEALEREHPSPPSQLSSTHAGTQQIFDLARRVADTDANVLILGESGTGKGVLAQHIHACSKRQESELVTINCPSLSAELLESELFGHTKGAYTGATNASPGRVSEADGGTLFLDEIGDFPIGLQAKLLRFIQDKVYERLGDPKTRHADVRIVSATNRDLTQMVSEQRFREDLLYRLNVITLTLPPLRERGQDIIDLAERFLDRFAGNYARPARRLSEEARQALLLHRWPGNVRELQNVVERAVILSEGEVIEPLLLGLQAQPSGGQGQTTALVGTDITLADLERLHIQAVLGRAETLDQAAKILDIDPSTLYRKRKALGLDTD